MTTKNISKALFLGFFMLSLSHCGGDDAPEKKFYRVGGDVTGLTGTLKIKNNDGDLETIKADGRYYFNTKIEDGEKYKITILELPEGQGCTIHHVSGKIDGADVTNADIDCISG